MSITKLKPKFNIMKIYLVKQFIIIYCSITKDTVLHEVSVIAIITLETKDRMNHIDVIQKLNSFEGLIHIEEL